MQLIENILVNLSNSANSALQEDTINSINALKDNPFQPYAVAHYRQSAYMFKTVMSYLDNLIAWGDSLYREDTVESINEATMLYVWTFQSNVIAEEITQTLKQLRAAQIREAIAEKEWHNHQQ